MQPALICLDIALHAAPVATFSATATFSRASATAAFAAAT
jgi:hypothetical protein